MLSVCSYNTRLYSDSSLLRWKKRTKKNISFDNFYNFFFVSERTFFLFILFYFTFLFVTVKHETKILLKIVSLTKKKFFPPYICIFYVGRWRRLLRENKIIFSFEFFWIKIFYQRIFWFSDFGGKLRAFKIFNEKKIYCLKSGKIK